MSIYRRRPFPIHLAVAVLSKGEQDEEEEGKMTKNHRTDEFPFSLSRWTGIAPSRVGSRWVVSPFLPPSSFLSGKKRVPPPVIN